MFKWKKKLKYKKYRTKNKRLVVLTIPVDDGHLQDHLEVYKGTKKYLEPKGYDVIGVSDGVVITVI